MVNIAPETREAPGGRPRISERWLTPPVLPQAEIYGLFGKRGSGKTATMIWFLSQEAAVNKRGVWYWPKELNFKYGEYIEAADLFSLPPYLKNGAIGLDEMQVLANSTQAVSTRNQMLGVFLQQVRKRGINVYFTSNEPERIEHSVERHTTYHFKCTLFSDPRCTESDYARQYRRTCPLCVEMYGENPPGKPVTDHGHHISSCQDWVRLQAVDTNRQHGIDPWHKDGRKRRDFFVHNLRDVYGMYNTEGIADYAEVLSIDKKKIIDRHQDKKAGMSFQDLCTTLRLDWVPWAVGEGHSVIVPAMFTAAVNEKFGLSIDARTMGKAFTAVGLQSVLGRADGEVQRRVTLPPPGKLKDWQDGLWSPD